MLNLTCVCGGVPVSTSSKQLKQQTNVECWTRTGTSALWFIWFHLQRFFFLHIIFVIVHTHRRACFE